MICFDVTPDKVPDGECSAAAVSEYSCPHPGVPGSSGIDHHNRAEREQASPWGADE